MKTRSTLVIQEDETDFAANNGLMFQGTLTERGEEEISIVLSKFGLTYIGQQHKL